MLNLRAVIDIHSHLLPGVDDGSPSIDASVPVIERFARDGVKVLVCTPHLVASAAHRAPYNLHLDILEDLRRYSPPEIELRLGWEIMLDAPGVDLTAAHLTLGPSKALLVEFTRGGLPPTASQELRRIVLSGRTPILAHPERYFGCTLANVRDWRAVGAVIQTDAIMLRGRGAPADLARSMLAEGLIDILASDNHGDSRSLGGARDWLLERGAAEQAELLLGGNAARVLEGEDPLPVPPFTVGMLTRIKNFFGKS